MAAQAQRTNEQDVDPTPLMDLINGMRASQALFAAVELGVIDVLDQAEAGTTGTGASGEEGGVSLSALAAAVGSKAGKAAPASEDGLGRLLDACCALQLVRRTSSGGFTLTALSRRYLASSSPLSLQGYVHHSAKVVWPMFGGLPAAVVKGGNVWEEVTGKTGPEIFKHLYADQAALLRFMRGMHSFAALSAPKVVTAFDLSKFKRWVDLGGATGALMVAAVQAYPEAHTTVVDMPHVVELAHQHFTRPPYVADPALLTRVEWAAGDLFGTPEALPRGDLYTLSRILHDWEEGQCKQILRTIHALLPPGGAVLIAEMLLDEDRNGPVATTLQSLNMLVQTHGRERTPSEYRALLEGEGFMDVQCKVTGEYLDAVLAFKQN